MALHRLRDRDASNAVDDLFKLSPASPKDHPEHVMLDARSEKKQATRHMSTMLTCNSQAVLELRAVGQLLDPRVGQASPLQAVLVLSKQTHGRIEIVCGRTSIKGRRAPHSP